MATISLAHVELGFLHGRPIVALHGAGGTGATWRRMATDGLPCCRWICPDLRGHGNSRGAEPGTLEQFAVDVLDLMESLGLNEVDMIGHSMGAKVAAEVCKQAKSRISNLILLDPPALMQEELPQFLRTLKSSSKPEQASKEWSEVTTFEQAVEYRMKFSAGCVNPVIPADAWPYALLEEKARLLLTEKGELKVRASTAPVGNPDSMPSCAPPDLTGYEGRVLLIRALHSGFSTTSGLEAIRKQLHEHLSIVTLNCGHEVLWEKYHECVGVVRDFLGYDA